MPQPFALIPTVSRQIAHEARTVPVVATPVSRVVNSREAPAAGHSGKRAPMCRFRTGCAQPGGVRFRSGSRLWGATASERGAMIHSHCGDLAEPSPLQAHTLLASACFAFRRDRVGAPERHIGDAVRHGLCERLTSG